MEFCGQRNLKVFLTLRPGIRFPIKEKVLQSVGKTENHCGSFKFQGPKSCKQADC